MRKIDFINQLEKSLLEQSLDLENELAGLEEEMAKETKSSAGDKFETSREMMNQARSGLALRLQSLKEQLFFVQNKSNQNPKSKVETGALVQTDQGFFFFGIALGKLEFGNESIIAMSFHSPLAKAFLGKKNGEIIEFRNRKFTVLSCS